MALRGTAGKSNTSSGNSVVVDVSGIGILQNDIILLLYGTGGGSSVSLTFPSGFNAIAGLGNNGNTTTSSDTVGVAYKIAGASEPTTYTCSAGVNDFMSLQARVYSGRSGLFTDKARSSASSAANPITYSITGVTAALNDDIVLLIGGSQNLSTAANTYTYTPPSGYGNSLVTVANSTQFSPILIGCDNPNVSAGATGTLGGTLNNSRGNTYAYTAYLISLAAVALVVPYPPMALGGMNVQVCM